jgi:hypothetical protein
MQQAQERDEKKGCSLSYGQNGQLVHWWVLAHSGSVLISKWSTLGWMEWVSPSKWHAWPQLLITCLKHITEGGPRVLRKHPRLNGVSKSLRESTTQMLIWSPHVSSSNPRYRVRESGRGLTHSRSHSACGQASPVGRGEANWQGRSWRIDQPAKACPLSLALTADIVRSITLNPKPTQWR